MRGYAPFTEAGEILDPGTRFVGISLPDCSISAGNLRATTALSRLETENPHLGIDSAINHLVPSRGFPQGLGEELPADAAVILVNGNTQQPLPRMTRRLRHLKNSEAVLGEKEKLLASQE